jgi:AraC family transcriptional regulator
VDNTINTFDQGDFTMTQLEVRIVRLDPMRVASAHGFGPSPEGIAWDKLGRWIQATGLLQDGQPHRFFGFNNPDPAPGSPNYGYEQWVTVGPEAQPSGEVEAKEFGGGLYAVTRARLVNIHETWMQFIAWLEQSPYHHAGHQWLEELISAPLFEGSVEEQGLENVILDLYMPISE